jgi:hypothetical protein
MMERKDSLDLTTTFTATLEASIPELPPVRRSARFLVLLRGRGGVQVAELGPSAARVVGRAAPADLIVDDASLSRQHARIRAQESGVWVEDLGSKNGTSCAGEPVESVLVQPGMQVS